MFSRACIFALLGLLSQCVSSTYGWRCHECGTGDALGFRFGRYRSADGVLVNRYGDLYRGEVRDNLPDGYGRLEYRKLAKKQNPGASGSGALMSDSWAGRIYEGEIRALVDYPRPSGHGTLTLPDGFRIEGVWNNGSLKGSATIVFPDGSRYSGAAEWRRWFGGGVCVKGQCTDAYGVLISSDATEYYAGTFSNRKISGLGVLTRRGWVQDSFSTTMIQAGRFLEGKLTSGTIFCIRSSRQCQSLLVRRHQNPKIRVDWVDRIDFFDGPARPTVADLETVARELLQRESPE